MKSHDDREIIDKFPLMSWLQQHFKVRDSGAAHLRMDCPVCKGQRTLGVNISQKLFHCFRCDDGGLGGAVWNGKANLFGFLRIVENLSPRATFGRLRQLSGLPDVPRAKFRPTASGWPREAIQLSTAPKDHPSVQMLANRGVGHLIPISKVCVTGQFSDRVLLPCNFLGEMTGFEAKTFVGANPKSKLEYFKSDAKKLYTSINWDRTADYCVITESIFDAETFGVNALGIFGSVLRDEQLLCLLELRKIGIRRLVWCLDGDARKKQENSIRRKTGLFFDNYVIPLPVGEDPNSLGRERSWAMLSEALPISENLDLLAA